eukprot:scaffold1613_cov17-Tisochrysis_lutea.AAC.1
MKACSAGNLKASSHASCPSSLSCLVFSQATMVLAIRGKHIALIALPVLDSDKLLTKPWKFLPTQGRAASTRRPSRELSAMQDSECRYYYFNFRKACP